MWLKFGLPLSLFVTSPTAGEPDLSGEFSLRGSTIQYRLSGTLAVAEVPDFPPSERYVKSIDSLRVTINDAETLGFGDLAGTTDLKGLLNLLVLVANRILKGIRNVGTVPHVSELSIPERSEPEYYMRRWNVLVGTAGGPERSLVDSSGEGSWFVELLAAGLQRDAGELDARGWADIVEAIERDLIPGPEQEFYTNALEHTRLKNYRLALLEAVICLEIVITQFLRIFLERRRLSGDRIGSFVNPQLGLKARVAVVLVRCSPTLVQS